jgi:hypothetical protein
MSTFFNILRTALFFNTFAAVILAGIAAYSGDLLRASIAVIAGVMSFGLWQFYLLMHRKYERGTI